MRSRAAAADIIVTISSEDNCNQWQTSKFNSIEEDSSTFLMKLSKVLLMVNLIN